mgnify:CR=1 FL=1
MSMITLIWAASLGGALLFFFSGFLLSRRMAISVGAGDASLQGQRVEQQLASMREQLRQAKAREGEASRALARAKEAEQSGTTRLEQAQTRLGKMLESRHQTLNQFGTVQDPVDRVDTLKEALDEALTTGKASDERAERLEGLLAHATSRSQDLEDRCATLEDKLQQAGGAGQRDSSRLTMPQWRPGDEREQMEDLLDGSRQEVETLTAAMKNLRRQCEDAERRTDEVRQQLDLRDRELKEARSTGQEVARLRKELEEMEREVQALQRKLTEAPGGTHYLHQDGEVGALQQQIELLQHQLEILRTENESLRELTEDTREDRHRGRQNRDTLPMNAMSGDITDSLKAYTEDAAVIGLVLSDASGLPVVHSGEYSEEVAAVAAHIAKLSAATAKLIPMGALARLSIQDVKARTVTIFPLAEEQLLLALLSDGAPPNEAALAEVMAQAEAMI